MELSSLLGMSDSHTRTLLPCKKVFKFKDVIYLPMQNQRNNLESPGNHNSILTLFYWHHPPMEPEVKTLGQPVMQEVPKMVLPKGNPRNVGVLQIMSTTM